MKVSDLQEVRPKSEGLLALSPGQVLLRAVPEGRLQEPQVRLHQGHRQAGRGGRKIVERLFQAKNKLVNQNYFKIFLNSPMIYFSNLNFSIV